MLERCLGPKTHDGLFLGFTLCGPVMRLWEFDRLGGVASAPIDVNKDSHMFMSVILGCLWMNEEELGFDPTVVEEEEEGCRYTGIGCGDAVEPVYLSEVIKRQRSVAGRATTCWKGWLSGDQSTPFVMKDSWEYEERPEEGLLLKEATEAGVKNIARYYHHETVHVGGVVDDVRDNVRKRLSNAVGRNAFQRRRAAMSEAVSSPATSDNSELGRGRSINKDATRKGRRALHQHHYCLQNGPVQILRSSRRLGSSVIESIGGSLCEMLGKASTMRAPPKRY